METNYLPLWKTLDTPLFSLDESHVELFSLLALFLLTLLAMVVRRHRQWIRHVVQGVGILIFVFVVYSCLGVFGMIRNTLHGVSLIGTVFTESFFWISLPLTVVAFTLTSGPYFCGWICPTGTFQEGAAALREYLVRWTAKTRLTRHLVRPRAPNLVALGLLFAGFLVLVYQLGSTRQFFVEDSSLHWGASLILIVFLVLLGRIDDAAARYFRAISLVIILLSAAFKTMIVSPVHFAFADARDPASALSTLVLVVGSLFISRAWCRYLCPWGFLMGKLHRVSRLRVKRVGECKDCGECGAVCRVGAVRDGKVSVEDCQFCLACVDHCPRGSLQVVDTWKRDDAED